MAKTQYLLLKAHSNITHKFTCSQLKIRWELSIIGLDNESEKQEKIWSPKSIEVFETNNKNHWLLKGKISIDLHISPEKIRLCTG